MNTHTLENTVKLPAWPLLVPCTHCELEHAQDTQHVTLAHLGIVYYDACSAACEQIILDKIARRLGSGQQRSFQLYLARKITDQQEEIGDLKQLIVDWQALVDEMRQTSAIMKYKIWQANYVELRARTVLALRERK